MLRHRTTQKKTLNGREADMKHFFAYMARMKYIRRWSLMKNSTAENVQEHTTQTAMIAHCLALISNRLYNGRLDENKAALLALYHEAGEVLTGDLPTPVKYFNPEIKAAYKNIEAVAEQRLLTALPQELRSDYEALVVQRDSPERRIVKYADKISAYLKCVEELRCGNNEFSHAATSIKAEIEAYGAPEVYYFMRQFAPSFALTLDELEL